MSRPVKLYDLAPSPNNIKVRLALAYKKIPYERIPVNHLDRSELVRVSGQPLAPVLVHGDSVVFDSYAILRYLDANWPAPPRLFGTERDTLRRIEEWELFNRAEVSIPVVTVFRESSAAAPDRDRIKKANDQMNRAASRIEEALARSPCLMGETANAADLTLAPMVHLGALSEAADADPIGAFFRRHMKIENAPKTLDWVRRVMALERR